VDAPKLHKDTVLAEKYPNGFFDLGLAHGGSGPLAVMSLTWGAASWIIERQVSSTAPPAYAWRSLPR
jgi:hypothetical protein